MCQCTKRLLWERPTTIYRILMLCLNGHLSSCFVVVELDKYRKSFMQEKDQHWAESIVCICYSIAQALYHWVTNIDWNKILMRENRSGDLQYIPRNMHTVTALLCFVVVINWLIFLYTSGLLHWHCGNLTIASVPAKQPWWIWINTSCEFIMNDCITTTKQTTTKPCAYFLGYTVNW